MHLGHLVETLRPCQVIGAVDPTTPLLGITDNSKRVRPGFVFVARKGVNAHGKRFVDDALANGSSCVLLEDAKGIDPGGRACLIEVVNLEDRLGRIAYDFYGEPQRLLRLIGITGTNGKTTSACLIQHVLSCIGEPCAYVGTLGAKVGMAASYEPLENTTPGIFEMAEVLNKALLAGARSVAIEVSSHALDQGRMEGLCFQAGVFMNLSHDHLDYHRSMEAYFQAKALLFRSYLKKGGFAGLNVDDPFGRRLFEGFTRGEKLGFGLSAKEGLSAKNITFSLRGTGFELILGEKAIKTVRIPLVGLHNVSNVLATLAVGIGLGFELGALLSEMVRLPQIPGRLELVEPRDSGCLKPCVFVDYAHTPDAVGRVLKTLKRLGRGRLIGVLGCGGDRDPFKRPIMGKLLAEVCDVAVLTQDNPRSEDPLAILKAMEEGASTSAGRFDGKCGYICIRDRGDAIEFALSRAFPEDTVAILGKGHEAYQLIRGVRYPFDDRLVARTVLDAYRPPDFYRPPS